MKTKKEIEENIYIYTQKEKKMEHRYTAAVCKLKNARNNQRNEITRQPTRVPPLHMINTTTPSSSGFM